MNIKKQRRIFKNEINPGSMADIGFLLLIFFLVSTTINVDKGISVLLPPLDDISQPVKTPSRNLCTILVNKENELLVRGKSMVPSDLSDFLKKFIANPGGDPTFASAPNKAVISLQNDRGTHYEIYISVYNEIKKAYNELRNEQAQILYQKSFSSCNKAQRIAIKQMIPMAISEADPSDLSL